MADSKITALTSIGTSTDPVLDQMVIVDVSDGSMAATGTTKKVSLNQLLATSPTATLASATITGDLTVDTSTLKVDSANNRVGIGTATPTDTLDVNGRVTAARFLSSSSSASLPALAVSAGNGVYNSGTNEVGFSVNSTLAMTLNSTGLGLGVTPSASTVRTVQSQYGVFVGNDELNVASNAYFGSSWKYVSAATAARYSQAAGVHYWFTAAAGAAANDPITTFAAANAKMTLDASGNLILQSSATPATLTVNGQLTVNATSNTNLRFSYRGSDGVTRVANLTLA